MKRGYIDYIREQAATPAQEKPNSTVLKAYIAAFRNLLNRLPMMLMKKY